MTIIGAIVRVLFMDEFKSMILFINSPDVFISKNSVFHEKILFIIEKNGINY